MSSHPLTSCLWFDKEAEEAAIFYTKLFRDGRITGIQRYGSEGKEIHGKEEGSVMLVNFEIMGQKFVALNGGPVFRFNEAISFQVYCDTQEEIDYYWEALTEGGEESQCGWLKDRYGLSWQVIPSVLVELMQDPERAKRVSAGMYGLKKLNINELKAF